MTTCKIMDLHFVNSLSTVQWRVFEKWTVPKLDLVPILYWHWANYLSKIGNFKIIKWATTYDYDHINKLIWSSLIFFSSNLKHYVVSTHLGSFVDLSWAARLDSKAFAWRRVNFLKFRKKKSCLIWISMGFSKMF